MLKKNNTPQKRNEKKETQYIQDLQSSLTYYEEIAETIRDPFLVLDYELRVLTANTAFYEMFRGVKEDTEGVLIYELGNKQWDIPQLRELLEQILPPMDDLLREKTVFNDFEVEHTFPDIGEKIMLLNARRIDHKQLILLAIEDITERTGYEQTGKHLEELIRQKDEFIGIASHELKTPVTSIKGYAQVLQIKLQKEGNRQAVELLTKMDAQINKLTNLIADLLDVTKIEGGHLQFHEDFFPVDEVVRECVEDMQQTTHKHEMIQRCTATSTIYGDKERIGQVMINLLANAIKYSPHANTIIISTFEDTDQVTFCVQDFGIGIPQEKQDKLFDRYYRVGGTELETFAGLGLGLYISAEIIKRHDGRIRVESVEGKGSTFCFTLPRKKRVVNELQTTTDVEEERRHE